MKYIKCIFSVFVLTLLVTSLLATSSAEGKNGNKGNGKVVPGIEVLLNKKLDWLENKRVGLITNPTGVDSNLESSVDLLYNHPDVNLTALFGPEHGIREVGS